MKIFEALGVIGLIGLLILAYLMLSNWKGTNAIISTAGGTSNQIIRTLQGR